LKFVIRPSVFKPHLKCLLLMMGEFNILTNSYTTFLDHTSLLVKECTVLMENNKEHSWMDMQSGGVSSFTLWMLKSFSTWWHIVTFGPFIWIRWTGKNPQKEPYLDLWGMTSFTISLQKNECYGKSCASFIVTV